MPIQYFRNKLMAFALGLGLLVASGWAHADPPLRVARLGHVEGQVSFSPAGETDWVQALVNRPLTTGDRLWVDARSRAELQIGGLAIRLGANSNVSLLNVDDNITQVQLLQGTVKLHVRYMGPNQILEVDTPNLALSVHRAGDYRLDVNPNGDATTVTVQGGEAEVYGDGASYVVHEGQGYRFFGTGLTDHESLTAWFDDDLDRWARDRDRRSDTSVSARYVSAELVGFEDLDANGTWRADPSYGYVWVPLHIRVGWTPYCDGHWAWINPWGWTWVDAAPWGYAVSHYGRWAHIRGAWAWVPGPVRERAVYAPALVVFLGASPLQSVGTVGWFPLAPQEVYRPAYRVSHGYFDHINRSNAVIAPSTITTVYNTHLANTTNVTNITNVTYVNQKVSGAVVAVPTQAFAQSQPVARAVVSLPRDAVMNAPVAHIAAVAPITQSVRGGTPFASAKPPTREQHVMARTTPPAPPIPFAAQQTQLSANPGAPIDDQRRAQGRPSAPAEPGPQVKMVTAVKPPAASAVPPAVVPHGKSPDERKPDAARVNPTPLGPQVEAARMDAARTEAAKVEADKAKAARDDATRVDAAREEAARANAARAAAARANALRDEAARADMARAAAARAQADNAKAAAREEAVRANAAREEAARVDAARARAAAARANAVREEAARMNTARAEAARAASTRVQAERAVAAPAPAEGHHAPNSEPDAKAKEKRNKAEEEQKKH